MCELSLILLGAIRAQMSRSINSLRVCIMVIFYFQKLLLFRNSFIKKCFLSCHLVTQWLVHMGTTGNRKFHFHLLSFRVIHLFPLI